MRILFRRALIWSAIAFAFLVIAAGVTIGPTMYRVLIGFHTYETTPPQIPGRLNDVAILVFSKTNGYRHDSIMAANVAIVELAGRHGWSAIVTENGAVFNTDQLRRFKVVVWNNVSGDVLTTGQRAAFESYLESGGGFVGIHGAGGDPSYAWKWYVDTLIGAQFIGHTMGPQFQQATIDIEDQTHPATRGLGTSWVRTDEWYSFGSNPRTKGYHVLASLDESSYRPAMDLPLLGARDIRIGRSPHHLDALCRTRTGILFGSGSRRECICRAEIRAGARRCARLGRWPGRSRMRERFRNRRINTALRRQEWGDLIMDEDKGMNRRAALAGIAATATAGLVGAPEFAMAARTGSDGRAKSGVGTIEIQVDLDKEIGKLDHIWSRCAGSDRAAITLREEWRNDLQRFQREAGLERVRFHGIFADELGAWPGGLGGRDPNFQNVDAVYDGLLARGVQPFVELSFMPQVLASGRNRFGFYGANVTPPKSLQDWGRVYPGLRAAPHWPLRGTRGKKLVF